MKPDKREKRKMVRLSLWEAISAIVELRRIAGLKLTSEKKRRDCLLEADNLERQVAEKYGNRSPSMKKAKGGA